jgi:hypothetical protein
VKVYKLCAVDGGPGFILPEFLIVFGFLLARRSEKKLVLSKLRIYYARHRRRARLQYLRGADDRRLKALMAPFAYHTSVY